MDYVVEWQDYETTFNNEKVTMMIHPLNIEALLKIAPHLKDAAVLDGGDNMALMVSSLELHKLSDAIMREHVKDVRGFTINGAQPDVEVIAKEAIFCNLVVDIIARLVTISSLSPGEEKNSEKPSTSPQSAEKTPLS
jgi:xanthine dehydrogenase iron-sulfur cluster and FAD-binding subunit A